MTTTNWKSEAFHLSRDGEDVVVIQSNDHPVDGIVTGIITSVIVFPFLSVFFLVGIWLIATILTDTEGFRFDPAFSRIAPPHVLRFAGLALVLLMGITFAGGSAWLFRMFLKALQLVFPYQCRFSPGVGGSWVMRRTLWFLPLPRRKLHDGWRLWCRPVCRRGDWGYELAIKDGKAKPLLASSGAYTESRSRARNDALRDMDMLKDLFGVSAELEKWGQGED